MSVIRTDCIECAAIVYHHEKDLYKCMEHGEAGVMKHTPSNHFIITLDGQVAASCLVWPDLPKSIEKMREHQCPCDEPPF